MSTTAMAILFTKIFKSLAVLFYHHQITRIYKTFQLKSCLVAVEFYSLIYWTLVHPLLNAPVDQFLQLPYITLFLKHLPRNIIHMHLYFLHFSIHIHHHATYICQIYIRLCHFKCCSISLILRPTCS